MVNVVFSHAFFLQTWTWSQTTTTGSVPAPRQDAAVTVVGSSLYVHGGRSNFLLDDLHVLDFDEMTWTKVRGVFPNLRHRKIAVESGSEFSEAQSRGNLYVVMSVGDQGARIMVFEILQFHVYFVLQGFSSQSGRVPIKRVSFCGHSSKAVAALAQWLACRSSHRPSLVRIRPASFPPFGKLLISLYESAKADCAEESGAAPHRNEPGSQFFLVRPFVRGRKCGPIETRCTAQETNEAVRRVEDSPSMMLVPARLTVRYFLRCRSNAAERHNPAVTRDRTPTLSQGHALASSTLSTS
jgi:hypothetical protein